MPRRELTVSEAAGTGSTVLLPGPRCGFESSQTTLSFSILSPPTPARNNVTPCYCSSMSQSRAIHDTKRLVWENIIVALEQNGKRGLAGEQRRTLSLFEPQPCSTVVSSYRSSLLPEQGENSQMTERWFIIGLRQLQTGLALPQSTCKAP